MSIIVITGASQGIGAALAEKFAEVPNVKLALMARNEANLNEVVARCQAKGAFATSFPCDLTDASAITSVTKNILSKLGAPDVVINNAGVFEQGSFLETTLDQFNTQISVNLTSAFLVTQAFLPTLLEAKHGHLFFMASVASLRGYPSGVAYCAAKHGLLGLARVVREETKSQGIRTTVIMPGATLTPSWAGVDLPESRFMPPEDIAQSVFDIWKLSDRSVVEEIVIRPQQGDL